LDANQAAFPNKIPGLKESQTKGIRYQSPEIKGKSYNKSNVEVNLTNKHT
jgi:hypothetical protein